MAQWLGPFSLHVFKYLNKCICLFFFGACILADVFNYCSHIFLFLYFVLGHFVIYFASWACYTMGMLSASFTHE